MWSSIEISLGTFNVLLQNTYFIQYMFSYVNNIQNSWFEDEINKSGNLEHSLTL